MLIKTKAIVLSRMKYSEADLIVRLYTEENGLVSIIVKGGRKKTKKSKAAFFQPLNILELSLQLKATRELHYAPDVDYAYKLIYLHTDMQKMALSFFLAEITYKALSYHEQDKKMYAFLEQSILQLNISEKSLANFHLVFLLKLAQLLGFGLTAEEDSLMAFRLSLSQNLPEDLEKRVLELHCAYDEAPKIRLNAEERRLVLNSLLDYYYFHHESMTKIQSLEVLSSLFHE